MVNLMYRFQATANFPGYQDASASRRGIIGVLSQSLSQFQPLDLAPEPKHWKIMKISPIMADLVAQFKETQNFPRNGVRTI